MSEIRFKVALAALLLVDAGIRLYYQRNRSRFERVVIRHELRENFSYIMVGLGLIPIFIYILTPWINSRRISFPSRVRWIGAWIVLAGDLLFIWSHKALGRNWSPILEIRRGHTLVTSGPYQFIRHPMYAAIFLIGIGITLLSANWAVALAYLLTVGIMYSTRVQDEEIMMQEQFGDEYVSYMGKTGRLLPSLSILKSIRHYSIDRCHINADTHPP